MKTSLPFAHFGCILIALMLLSISVCAQTIPQQISLQGKLMESGSPVTGTRDFFFSFQGTTWSETQYGVPVNNGIYSVTIGSINPIPVKVFDASDSAVLQIIVNGNLLSPDIAITASGYAFKAEKADDTKKIGGYEVSDLAPEDDQFLKWNGAVWKPADPQWGENNLDLFYLPGYVGLGTSTPSAQLHTTGTVTFAGISGTGDIVGIDEFGNLSRTAASEMPSGTLGQTLRYDGSQWVATDLLFNTGDNIGIGTTSPYLMLEVSGSDIQVNGLRIGRGNGNDQYSTILGLNALENIIQGIGNVSIGSYTMFNNPAGNSNTVVGSSAGYGVVGNTYSDNSLFGFQAGYSLTTGSGNILMGYRAGDNIGSGSGNIIIGYDLDAPLPGGSDQVVLGAQDLFFGDLSAKRIGIGTTAPTAQLHTTGTVRFTGLSGTGTLVSIDAYGNLAKSTASVLPAGSTGQTLRHDGSVWIASTLLSNNGTGIGIGTTTPSEKLTLHDGHLALTNSSSAGELRLFEPSGYGTNYSALRAQAQSANVTYTLPAADGASGNILSTNGSGQLSWITPTTADITAVGSMTSGDVFAGASADNQWLGLGAAAGRIEFDDQTIDEVNILDARVGIGTSTPGHQLVLTESMSIPATTSSTIGVIFKGSNRFIHNYGTNSTYVGESAGNYAMTGHYNSAFGRSSLTQNTTGSHNTAVGTYSLTSNTVGANIAAFGAYTLYNNTKGNYNTALGSFALYNNTTASNNTAVGRSALYSQSYSNNDEAYQSSNTAVGFYSMYYNQPVSEYSGAQNVGVGSNSLYYNTIGSYNTAVGTNALYDNSKGNHNVAVGRFAMTNNTTASQNTAIGNGALQTQSFSNSSAVYNSNNVAMGYNALYSNQPTSTSNGVNNTALGAYAMTSNTIGFNNTATGADALRYNTIGNDNTAYGRNALYSNTTANSNVAIGKDALYTLSFNNGNTVWESNNVAVGVAALYSNQTYNLTLGIENTALGNYSLYSNTIGKENLAGGYQAVYSNVNGSYNIGLGNQSLYNNICGNYNIAIGGYTLFTQSFSNGGLPYSSSNIAIGFQSLLYNQPTTSSNGIDNIAIGTSSMAYNTTGKFNVGCGTGTLLNNHIGSNNVAIGYRAMGENATQTSVVSNVAIGLYAGGKITTGYGNVLIGEEAGRNISTGYDNVWIGKMIGNSGTLTYNNSVILGSATSVTASNQVRIGNSSMTSIGGYANWTNLSDERFKRNISDQVPGLAFILKLRPVTYTLDMNAIAAFTNIPNESRSLEDEANKGRMLQTGFLAQEVEQAASELGYDFSGVDKPKNNQDFYGLRYAEFTVPLVKAVQEQQQMIQDLQTQNTTLQEQIDVLLKRIEVLEGK